MTRNLFDATAGNVASLRLLELIDKWHWTLDRGWARVEHHTAEVRKQLMATGCGTGA
jgi:hypothetical protein